MIHSYDTYTPSYFYEKGSGDSRSLLEVLIGNDTLNESLASGGFSFREAEREIMIAVLEAEETKDAQPILRTSKTLRDRAQDSLSKASDLIGKGVQIGKDFYKGLKSIMRRISRVFVMMIEKVKRMLKASWEYSSAAFREKRDRVKNFTKEKSAGIVKESMLSILKTESANREMEEAPRDIRGAVEKVTGKFKIPRKAEEDALKSAEELVSAEDPDEVEMMVLGENLMTSMKGLILEGHTLQEVESVLESDAHETKSKGIMGWMVEAIGFILNPFSKLYQYALKGTVNGTMILTSAMARGGVKDAYKYVTFGTIAAMVYEIIHGLEVTSHGIHESVNFKDMAKSVDVTGMLAKLKPLLGEIFLTAANTFMPVVVFALEIILISIASFELCVACCSLKGEYGELAACKIVNKIHHSI